LLLYFSTWFFFVMIFFKIFFVDFIFLRLSWLRIKITIKLKSCAKNTIASLTKHLDCYSISPQGFFFLLFFQNCLCWFFFLILSWLRITITSKTKSCGEALYLSSQNTVYCYSVSNMVFFSFFVFFLLWFFLNYLCWFFF